MSDSPLEEARQSWNLLAADWRIQVGTDGDSNRRLNSDPVLWELAGDGRGLAVLDAGYLSRKLRDRGAVVTGVDLAERMVEIARADHPGIDFRVDSCTELVTCEDGQFDLVVAHYVLRDTPDLMRAFARVLKPGGAAVLVFSHPCFPQGSAIVSAAGEEVYYRWDFPYFEARKCIDPPWAHFKSDFLWFHRPLSDYWKAFTAAGFPGFAGRKNDQAPPTEIYYLSGRRASLRPVAGRCGNTGPGGRRARAARPPSPAADAQFDRTATIREREETE